VGFFVSGLFRRLHPFFCCHAASLVFRRRAANVSDSAEIKK
jgi:hypothetical protein